MDVMVHVLLEGGHGTDSYGCPGCGYGGSIWMLGCHSYGCCRLICMDV